MSDEGDALEGHIRDLQRRIDALRSSGITTSTWGLLATLLALLAVLATIVFTVLTILSEGATLPVALLAILLAVIASLIALLLLLRERGLLQQVQALQRQLEKALAERGSEGSGEDGRKEGQ